MFVEPNLATESDSPRRFATTRWSVILAAGANSESITRTALAELCRLYWRPIFAFICRRGHSINDAQDLTQDFFMKVLEGDLLRRANPGRGRFRSLLLKSLQGFLSDTHERGRAKKRGGDLKFVSWEDWMAEAPSHLQLSQSALASATPERLFDIRWAATVVEQAKARLGEECAARGRRRVFDVLNGYLSIERSDVSYSKVASQLGVEEDAVRRFLHRLRVRYRAILREEVARTVETDADIENEIRYLCAALAAGWQ